MALSLPGPFCNYTDGKLCAGPVGEQVSEVNGSGTWQHTNVFAEGKLLATYDAAANEAIFAVNDWLGSKRMEYGPSAGCSSTDFSLPYGNQLTVSGNCPDATEHHLTGKERDAETSEANGNDYFGARYYASSIGRWMSPDPTGLALANAENPQSLNLFAYVNNNPFSMIDPDGLQVEPSAYCNPGWLCHLEHFLKRVFNGGRGSGSESGGSDGSDGGWSSTPHPGKNLVNVYYPRGAGGVGGHISVGTYDSEDTNPKDPWSDPHNAFGFTTVNQGWYVRTMLILGWPFFKGTMEADAHSPRSRKGVEYRYLSISDEGFAAANTAILNHNGNYRFWLFPRNCANAAEDVDHAAGAPWVPHHEIFWPHVFWWLSPVGWAH